MAKGMPPVGISVVIECRSCWSCSLTATIAIVCKWLQIPSILGISDALGAASPLVAVAQWREACARSAPILSIRSWISLAWRSPQDWRRCSTSIPAASRGWWMLSGSALTGLPPTRGGLPVRSLLPLDVGLRTAWHRLCMPGL